MPEPGCGRSIWSEQAPGARPAHFAGACALGVDKAGDRRRLGQAALRGGVLRRPPPDGSDVLRTAGRDGARCLKQTCPAGK
jgi:hypothetical protein